MCCERERDSLSLGPAGCLECMNSLFPGQWTFLTSIEQRAKTFPSLYAGWLSLSPCQLLRLMRRRREMVSAGGGGRWWRWSLSKRGHVQTVIEAEGKYLAQPLQEGIQEGGEAPSPDTWLQPGTKTPAALPPPHWIFYPCIQGHGSHLWTNISSSPQMGN